MFYNPFPRRILLHRIIRKIQDHVRNQFCLIVQILVRACDMPAADCCIGIRIRQIEAQYISIMRWPVSGSLTDDSSDIIITSESQQKSCRTESTSATDEYYITLENLIRVVIYPMSRSGFFRILSLDFPLIKHISKIRLCAIIQFHAGKVWLMLEQQL